METHVTAAVHFGYKVPTFKLVISSQGQYVPPRFRFLSIIFALSVLSAISTALGIGLLMSVTYLTTVLM